MNTTESSKGLFVFLSASCHFIECCAFCRFIALCRCSGNHLVCRLSEQGGLHLSHHRTVPSCTPRCLDRCICEGNIGRSRPTMRDIVRFTVLLFWHAGEIPEEVVTEMYVRRTVIRQRCLQLEWYEILGRI